MLAYQPESPKRWLAGIDDSTIPKRRAQPILDNRVEHYQFINDLCSWALNCTLKYCRYRMRWGEWSIEKRGKYCDRGDSFFFNRPESQRACKFLVGWFVRFANARRQFHSLIESKIKCPSHSQTRTAKSVQEIIADHVGRPAKLKMGKTANEDLWLILTWPIVVFHHWTYKDVVRAVRLHFGHGHLQRPVPSMTPQEAAQAIENWSERNAPRSHFWKPSWMTRETAKAIEHFTEWQRPIKPVEKYMPKAATDWRVEAMKVSDADAEVMRLRCNRLHLDKLNPKRRDIASEPRFFGLVNVFHATD